MKLLYLHVRDSKSLYKDTCIHFDPTWRFEEKGERENFRFLDSSINRLFD